jgi:hypothetical protein
MIFRRKQKFKDHGNRNGALMIKEFKTMFGLQKKVKGKKVR